MRAREPEPTTARRGRDLPFAALTLAFLLAAAFPGLAQDPPENPGRLTGRVLLSGSVADEGGRALSGVTVKVTEFEPTYRDGDKLAGTRERTRWETVDGYFRFECEDCLDMELRLEREGFVAETVSSATDDPSEIRMEPVEEGSRLEIERRGLQVVLRAIADLAVLERISGRLTATDDGPEYVLVLTGGGTLKPVLHPRVQEKVRGKAEPLATWIEALLVEEESGADELERSVVLDFSHAGGGIRLLQGEAVTGAAWLQGMVEAPEDGYESRVTLVPAREGKYYFFCRIGEQYGKGVAGPPRLAKSLYGDRAVKVPVEIYLNPDGSRNLRSLR